MNKITRCLSIDKIVITVKAILIAGGIFFPIYHSYATSLDDFTIEKIKKERSIQSEITYNTPTDPTLVMSQVHLFCTYLRQKKSLAFKLYKENQLESIDKKIELSVHTLRQAKVIIDAAHPETEGKKILFNLDAIGRFYIAEMNKLVTEYTCGWIEYFLRPKDSEKSIIMTSYACKCECEKLSETYVISASIPNVSKRQILNQLQELQFQK